MKPNACYTREQYCIAFPQAEFQLTRPRLSQHRSGQLIIFLLELGKRLEEL